MYIYMLEVYTHIPIDLDLDLERVHDSQTIVYGDIKLYIGEKCICLFNVRMYVYIHIYIYYI